MTSFARTCDCVGPKRVLHEPSGHFGKQLSVAQSKTIPLRERPKIASQEIIFAKYIRGYHLETRKAKAQQVPVPLTTRQRSGAYIGRLPTRRAAASIASIWR
jgi:hypothetical protein